MVAGGRSVAVEEPGNTRLERGAIKKNADGIVVAATGGPGLQLPCASQR